MVQNSVMMYSVFLKSFGVQYGELEPPHAGHHIQHDLIPQEGPLQQTPQILLERQGQIPIS